MVAAGGKVTARKTDPSEHSVTSVVSDVKAESIQVPLFGQYCCVERHVTEMFVTLLTQFIVFHLRVFFKWRQILHYITLRKIIFRMPKITRTARTLYEIKGVMWEGVQLCGKTFGEKISF